jgi:hypothetical protein
MGQSRVHGGAAMNKDHDHPYTCSINERGKKAADMVAALLGLDGNGQALCIGLDLALQHAKASVTGGRTEVVFCKPELAALLENNQKFIEALCEEGVVEWLTPFVLTKSKQSTTDTNQP